MCAYLKHANGVRGELQLIGKDVLAIANAEHIPYDVLLRKPLVRNVPKAAEVELQSLVKPMEAAMDALTQAQKAQYLQYLNPAYIHARMMELGKASTAPPLPPGLNPILSTERFQALERSIAAIKARYKSP